MTYNKFNHENNAICLLSLSIADDATVLIGSGAYNRFPTSNFIIQVTETDTDGNVTARENILIATRSGSTFTVAPSGRAYEPVPIDDDATSSIQQALPFTGGVAVIENVMSTAVIEDAQNEITRLETDKLAKTGGTVTGNITMDGVIYDDKSANLASATTTNLATATGKEVHITGTTTITAFGTLQAGAEFTLIFDGILTLTHNAVSLILPNNGTNITTAAGDSCIITSEGGGNWKVTQYQKANGRALQEADTSSFGARTKTFTASGNIAAYDYLYVSAADTAKRLYPSDVQTLGASPTTSPTTNSPCRVLPISAGLVLQVSGSDGGSGGYTLKAQVRTINAAEADFSNGSEATLFGSAVTWFDVCQIDTSTWVAIYNKGASGAIACVAFTISGTTITVGSEQSIEASGTASWKCSIAKVDTLKCLITYMKASDSKPYVQVLTVSGTAISTNTPVLLKNSSNGLKTSSCQITTNQVLIVYGDSVSTVYAVTVNVSGTTPTVNSEATVQNIGTGSRSAEVKRVSDTKAVCVIETGGSNELGLKVLSLSGTGNNTISAGATTTITGANANNNMRGLQIIGDGYLLFSSYRTTPTDMYVNYYSIGATTTTLISTQTTAASSSASYPSVAIGKISPWTYLVTGMAANSDFIVKLNPVSTARIGVAESSIADTLTGAVVLRFQKATLAGLSVGKYYVDDDGRLTQNSSLTAPEAGIALSSTDIILT